MRRSNVLISLAVCALLASGCSSSGAAAPSNVRLPVAFGLERDQAGLAAAVQQISSPGSGQYQQWLTPAQVATEFGASPETAAAALTALQAAGFEGALDPTGSILIGTMSVQDAETLLGTSVVETAQESGEIVVAPAKALEPPSSVSGVAEVVGLTALLPGAASPSPSASSGPPPTCPESKGLGASLRQAYGLAELQSAGNTGKGVSLALLEVSPTSQQAIDLFSSCNDAPIPPVTVNMVDDSPAAVFGDVAQESTLDIAAASLMAPGLSGITVYQFNPYSPLVFPFAAALADAYAPDGPSIISTSVGFCETDVTQPALDISEWLLMSAAATGVTVVASAGDTGSSGCAPGSTDQASQYPSSSPNVLSVGGTQWITAGDPQSGQQVWNAAPTYAGGGSSVSSLPQPAYQAPLGIAGGRLTPDVSFLSSPADIGPIPICTTSGSCSFTVVGGTSATAPGVAGGLASVVQSLGGARLGLLNWALYSQTPTDPSQVNDVTAGTNDLYNVGCCTAGPGYDTASGWGSIDFGAVAAYFKNAGAAAT